MQKDVKQAKKPVLSGTHAMNRSQWEQTQAAFICSSSLNPVLSCIYLYGGPIIISPYRILWHTQKLFSIINLVILAELTIPADRLYAFSFFFVIFPFKSALRTTWSAFFFCSQMQTKCSLETRQTEPLWIINHECANADVPERAKRTLFIKHACVFVNWTNHFTTNDCKCERSSLLRESVMLTLSSS